MPCDSPAAGLVALGALVQRLCLQGADDVSEHLQQLRRLSAELGDSLVLKQGRKNSLYTTRVDGEGFWAVQNKGGLQSRQMITEHNAKDWHVQGEPMLTVEEGDALPGELYRALAGPGCELVPENLRHSDSRICLAGRPVGESPTRRYYDSHALLAGDLSATISSLLAVNWVTGTKISRMNYYSPRTGRGLSRHSPQTDLVVADGDVAYLSVIDHEDLREASVIGLVNRCIDRNRLETFQESVQGKLRWYPSCSPPASMPAPPRGVSIGLLAEAG